MQKNDRFKGCLLGLAVGDAVGTTVEFSPPGTFPPVEDMTGGGPFDLEPGQWTDDASMALCLAESLIEKKGFDARDQMERYCMWMDDGYFSSTGHFFDIGDTISKALESFQSNGEPFSGSIDPRSAGNGSIMRLAPIPMFYERNLDDVWYYSGESSRTTHGTAEAVDACKVLGLMIAKALRGEKRDEILFGNLLPLFSESGLAPKINSIAVGNYRDKKYDDLKGSGYVVASLEAALWCFYNTETFRDAVLMAVNLGNDADTTGAVTGQIAGAYYGFDGIPSDWLKKLAMRDTIEKMAMQLFDIGRQ